MFFYRFLCDNVIDTNDIYLSCSVVFTRKLSLLTPLKAGVRTELWEDFDAAGGGVDVSMFWGYEWTHSHLLFIS